MIYHVLNRAKGRLPLFEKPRDYEAFEKVRGEAHERFPMRMVAYCVLPNHWHLVLWPRRDQDRSRFMAWVTLTPTQRWHAQRRSAGAGHL
jgi:putative transposase